MLFLLTTSVIPRLQYAVSRYPLRIPRAPAKIRESKVSAPHKPPESLTFRLLATWRVGRGAIGSLVPTEPFMITTRKLMGATRKTVYSRSTKPSIRRPISFTLFTVAWGVWTIAPQLGALSKIIDGVDRSTFGLQLSVVPTFGSLGSRQDILSGVSIEILFSTALQFFAARPTRKLQFTARKLVATSSDETCKG